MSQPNMILSSLDFETNKEALKNFLRSQDRFRDYDFDGANINVLLDLLSHNTFLQSYYLNMIASEMFLDTAQIRDSIVSHAKELNYVPRSFKSAEAKVVIQATVPTSTNKKTLVIPKGTSFTSRIGNRSFTFTTDENIVVSNFSVEGNSIVFLSDTISLYEGDYILESFVFDPDNNQRIVISNRTIDTSSLSVTIIEDSGATTIPYTKASSLFGLGSDSAVFFVQGAENDSYEIVFGDDVIGRKPKKGSSIIVEYRTSSGELPNGCNSFRSDGSIDGSTSISVFTTTKAAGGSINESIESIKYNAPRHFTTQERAVTTDDYETLLKINFPEVNAVSAYGGEEATPPQYGKVFVAVDLKEVDGLPDVKKTQYKNFLKGRSPVAIDPVIVGAEYLYLSIDSEVNYNINLTSLNIEDIRTLVIAKILEFADTNLNNFNRTLRYSRMINSIDNAHSSIVSNETNIRAVRYLQPILGTISNYVINFDLPLLIQNTKDGLDVDVTISSASFVYNGIKAHLRDDSEGRVFIVSDSSGQTITEIGTVDYDSGTVNLFDFQVSSYSGQNIKIHAITNSKDIFSRRNVIINISEEDISVSVNQVRE